MEDPGELEKYWSIVRPEPSAPGSSTMHVGEALERITRAIRRYYDSTGHDSETFTLVIDNQGNGPVNFKIRVICHKLEPNKKEWDTHNNGGFYKTLEDAAEATFRSVIQRISKETEGWLEEVQETEKKLTQLNEVVAELRRNIRDMGAYLPPQASLPFVPKSEDEDENEQPDDDNGPVSSVC